MISKVATRAEKMMIFKTTSRISKERKRNGVAKKKAKRRIFK
jgi:hypothetical protein